MKFGAEGEDKGGAADEGLQLTTSALGMGNAGLRAVGTGGGEGPVISNVGQWRS